jgi:hypothetical protein
MARGNRRDRAKAQLLRALNRDDLESLAMHERPWTLTRKQLADEAVKHWSEIEVRACIESVFLKTAD